MTVAFLIGLLCGLWVGTGEVLTPANYTLQYPTLIHSRIVNGLDANLPAGLMISHGIFRTAMGVLLAGSDGLTADEVLQAMPSAYKQNKNNADNRRPLTDKFKEVTYVGVYLPPYLQPRDAYEDKILDMGVDLVYTYPNKSMERLKKKLKDIIRNPADRDRLVPKDFPIPKRSAIYVVAAAEFRGRWADSSDFSPMSTRMREFRVNEKRRINVATLFSLAKVRQVANLHSLRARMLLLPLKDSRVKFMVLLPNLVEGLRNLEKALEYVDLRSLLRSKMETSKYDVILPVLNILTNVNLANNLQYLGIKRIFSPLEADLSRLTGSRLRLYVKRLQHMTKISLSAEGINVKFNRISSGHIYIHERRDIKHFHATHPFFFALLDEQRIYATGRYGNFLGDPENQEVLPSMFV